VIGAFLMSGKGGLATPLALFRPRADWVFRVRPDRAFGYKPGRGRSMMKSWAGVGAALAGGDISLSAGVRFAEESEVFAESFPRKQI